MGDDLADLVSPAGLAVARVHALPVDARLLLRAALVARAPRNCKKDRTHVLKWVGNSRKNMLDVLGWKQRIVR